MADHLTTTAELAASFAREFTSDQWAYLAGLWHDLGKYSQEFQEMLQGAADEDAHIETRKGRVDHSTAGAIYAVKRFGTPGMILSYIIAGHHAGLPDFQSPEAGNRSLFYRLQREDTLKRVDLSSIPEEILSKPLPTQKFRTRDGHALWIRMLYSSVVDADFLDTEAYIEPEKADLRGGYPQIEELLPPFNEYMKRKQSSASDTPVNRQRAQILRQCIEKATMKPSTFTLTVPTGGGKTLSSMAFALNHASAYGKKRVIYVIPYTSIIEQTAEQFREIFGDCVIEHHSNIDVSDEAHEDLRSRLASENWDAPVIVTTTVQFFESLFSNRPSRCRKLHNIVNAVVVLDEVQLLPPEFLNPILHVIKELQRNYGVTFLLSTATQPALKAHEGADFHFEGIEDTVEIIDTAETLYQTFKRVEIKKPSSLEPVSWEALAEELQEHERVLCIVNRRDDCRALYELMPEGTYHLSALMCGAHRSVVIAEIKERLKKGQSTRVVSTQLVEAGVDLDFPVVYRAMAGLDSIAQAAGRCNREGLLDRGLVKVFVPPSNIPPGYLRQAAGIAQRIITEEDTDILAPQTFDRYFRELYWIQGDNLDKHRILDCLRPNPELKFSFYTVALKFRIIDDSLYRPVLVRYGEGERIIDLLGSIGPERWLLRKAQRYVVNLPRYVHEQLLRSGDIREIHPGIFVQQTLGMYREDIGFDTERAGIQEPDELIL